MVWRNYENVLQNFDVYRKPTGLCHSSLFQLPITIFFAKERARVIADFLISTHLPPASNKGSRAQIIDGSYFSMTHWKIFFFRFFWTNMQSHTKPAHPSHLPFNKLSFRMVEWADKGTCIAYILESWTNRKREHNRSGRLLRHARGKVNVACHRVTDFILYPTTLDTDFSMDDDNEMCFCILVIVNSRKGTNNVKQDSKYYILHFRSVLLYRLSNII